MAAGRRSVQQAKADAALRREVDAQVEALKRAKAWAKADAEVKELQGKRITQLREIRVGDAPDPRDKGLRVIEVREPGLLQQLKLNKRELEDLYYRIEVELWHRDPQPEDEDDDQ